MVKEAHLRCAGHQTAGVRTSYLVSLFAQACVLHFAIVLLIQHTTLRRSSGVDVCHRGGVSHTMFIICSILNQFLFLYFDILGTPCVVLHDWLVCRKL